MLRQFAKDLISKIISL